MFYYSQDKDLTPDVLNKMINHFNINVKPKLIKYKNYYDGLQKIQQKEYADKSKPCNRTVINYCKNISDSYCGYIATPSYISYKSDGDISDIMDILKYNDYQSEDADFLLNALVYGTAAELMFIDADGKTRFRLINPTSCFGIYDDSLTSDLIYFVRVYKASEWDESNTYCVDVYSDYDIRHYTMEGENGNLVLVNTEPHYFSQVPANIFNLPDEKSIFDCIMSLQDSANELVSAEVDDYTAFCDAYLALIGVDAEPEDIKAMKENRVLILPPGSTVNWVTKNASDTQIENILKRVHESIYRVAACPDFSSEAFVGGVSSGVAIRYRLTGMETRAGVIEAAMKKALLRRIEIICGIASLKYGNDYINNVSITFKRNIPEDYTALMTMINTLKGSVSDATLLEQLPFISDVNKELEKLKQQKEENMSLYNFGNSFDDEDEEDN